MSSSLFSRQSNLCLYENEYLAPWSDPVIRYHLRSGLRRLLRSIRTEADVGHQGHPRQTPNPTNGQGDEAVRFVFHHTRLPGGQQTRARDSPNH